MPENFDAALRAYKDLASPPKGASCDVFDAYFASQAAVLRAVGWTPDEFWAHYPRTPEYIIDLTGEYLESKCTCEISVDAAYIAERTILLQELNQRLAPKGARWVAWHCETCVGHTEGKRPIHLAIETYSFCPYSSDKHVFDQKGAA